MNRFIAAKLLITVLVWLGLSPCLEAQRPEKYRSQYHFSPNNGWIGDPDGLVHYRGVYHLFWWGHAISRDLVHWTELPYPILGDPEPYRTDTGASVIDKHNVSGLGTDSFINSIRLLANTTNALVLRSARTARTISPTSHCSRPIPS